MPELADDGMVYLSAIDQWFTLHDMGNDGWEFVAIIIPMREFQGKPMARVLFKRPVEEWAPLCVVTRPAATPAIGTEGLPWAILASETAMEMVSKSA